MSKGTARRTIRVDADLWDAAVAKAERDETTVSEVVRAHLVEWVEEPDQNDE